ncbi:hypothetical protein QUB80_12120 [Chlorogloeopsis sp. ULAP01]|uniref:hypothetical protein n=1 Tax=Chlorogloeopsis sp. ULAP01 TaxID=3056483 RepID=UPI0025AA34EA|nr:hypothetical protein [Chlorogloeopsis sp. ULAP01]MDM9381447.1 hypothetical protein [Chlorogloeopsis sp. ULAP01]
MNTQELFDIADKVIYKSTGKHLSDLQADLLKASFQNKTYEQFANDRGYCLDYIKKDVGSLLWNVLSQALGEKITKKNFRQALERYQQAQELLNVGDAQKRLDVCELVETSALSRRTQEFGTLKQLLRQGKCRFVAFVALTEVEQSSWAVKLIEPIENEFDGARGRSLPHTEPLASLVIELVPLLPNQQQPKIQIGCLLQYLSSDDFLLVLDNAEVVLQVGKLLAEDSQSYAPISHLEKLRASIS